jgi:hypothetical protein
LNYHIIGKTFVNTKKKNSSLSVLTTKFFISDFNSNGETGKHREHIADGIITENIIGSQNRKYTLSCMINVARARIFLVFVHGNFNFLEIVSVYELRGFHPVPI